MKNMYRSLEEKRDIVNTYISTEKTLREIAKMYGCNRQTVLNYINLMQKQDYPLYLKAKRVVEKNKKKKCSYVSAMKKREKEMRLAE